MSSPTFDQWNTLDATELADLICVEGRQWLDALPPCLEGSDVLEYLRPAIAAWHAHELEEGAP